MLQLISLHFFSLDTILSSISWDYTHSLIVDLSNAFSPVLGHKDIQNNFVLTFQSQGNFSQQLRPSEEAFKADTMAVLKFLAIIPPNNTKLAKNTHIASLWVNVLFFYIFKTSCQSET